jgi:hypothetical protein
MIQPLIQVQPKSRWGRVIKDTIVLAHKKGLVVGKNSFNPGYCITMPNGSTYHADGRADMVRFVRGY